MPAGVPFSLLAFLATVLTAAGQSCVYEGIDGFVFDLTDLRNNTDDYVTSDAGTPQFTYHLNLCRDVVVSACGAGCAACQVYNAAGDACLGRTYTQQFNPPDRTGASLRASFTAGDRSWDGTGDRSFEIDFFCDPNAGKGQPQFAEESPLLNYQFTWNTSFACGISTSEVSPSQTYVFIDEGQRGLDGGPSGAVLVFNVQLRNKLGGNIVNDAEAANVTVTGVIDSGLPTEEQFAGVYAGRGVFVVSYQYAGPHGSHNLTVRVYGVQVPTAYVITITPGPAYANLSSVTFDAASTYYVGTVYYFHIDLRDFSNTPISQQNPGDVIGLQLVGPTVVKTTIVHTEAPEDNSTSRFTGFYTAAVPALYTVAFTVNGVPAVSNPPTIRIDTELWDKYPCTYELNGLIYNLSAVRNVSGDYDLPLYVDGVYHDMWINFCGPTVETECGEFCALCQDMPQTHGFDFCLGRTGTIQITPPVAPGDDGQGFSALFTGGDQITHWPYTERQVRFDFTCDHSAGLGGPFNVTEPVVAQYVVQWRSAFACATATSYVAPNISRVYEADGQRGISGGRNGDSVAFNVQLVDGNGLDFTNDTIASRVTVWAILDDGLSQPPIDGVYLVNGTFTVPYRIDGTVGLHNLSVYVLGVEVVGSPYVVQFELGPADAAQSSAVFMEETPVAGSAQLFYVALADLGGNRILDDQGDNVSVTLRGPLTVGSNIEYTNSTPVDGARYVGGYATMVAGSYTVDFAVNGAAAAADPSVIVVTSTGVAAPSDAVVSGPGLTDPHPGAAGSVVIQLRDQYDNNITQNVSATWAVSVSPSEPAGDLTPVYTDGGRWVLTYNLTKAAKYSMSVSLNSEVVAGSPFNFSVPSGPVDPPSCTASGDGTTDAEAHAAAKFTITSRDRWGNVRDGQDDNFTVWVVDGGDRVQNTVTLENNHDGTYAGSYEVFVEGAYWLNVQFNGAHISGSPFEIKCDSDANDPKRNNIIDELSTGAIIGIVVGCVVVTSLLSVLGFCIVYRGCLSRKKDYNQIMM